MAKSKKDTIRVKALVNLKYDKDCFAIGNELNVRAEDAQKMVDKFYVELLEVEAVEEEVE